MPTYKIRERANDSTKHQLSIQKNIITVKRLGEPAFTLDLDISKGFTFVALTSIGQVTQPLLNKAIAFAKNNVAIHD